MQRHIKGKKTLADAIDHVSYTSFPFRGQRCFFLFVLGNSSFTQHEISRPADPVKHKKKENQVPFPFTAPDGVFGV